MQTACLTKTSRLSCVGPGPPPFLEASLSTDESLGAQEQGRPLAWSRGQAELLKPFTIAGPIAQMMLSISS